MKTFRLTDTFLSKYEKVQPPFGFGALGEIVYIRTYSRIKPDGNNERWWETVRRVVEGTYNMQKRHIYENRLEWNENKAQLSAQEMFDRIFNMKFLPPGRGLWAMGSPLTEERGLFATLNNCAFVSTENLKEDLEEPFSFLMDALMLGVGVGFDTMGSGKLHVRGFSSKTEPFVVTDDREGWVTSTSTLIRNGLTGAPRPEIDYSLVRPAGLPIKGFGGTSSGPGPLKVLHERIGSEIDKNAGKHVSVEFITNLMNFIAACIVSGNVRKGAEIAFGEPDDEEFLNLKNYQWNAEKGAYEGPRADRADFGWASNNTVKCPVGLDYTRCGDRTGANGEPGYAWLDNMRKFGRMIDRVGGKYEKFASWLWKDKRAKGGNPCLEQSLESYELCCLVETFPERHESAADYLRTLKFAYLYAKTVTLGKTHWAKTNQVMLRNRRIGCSMSGVQQFVASRGIETLRQWCDSGFDTINHYDKIYSDWLCIPRSIKVTSIKPSGTVSILAGATPGMHWPEDLYYLRRIRLATQSPLVAKLAEAGYDIEPCVGQEATTVVVSLPVKVADPTGKLRPVHEVSPWEQLSMAAFLQKWWADNQVSCTITFLPERDGGQIKHMLNYYQYELKGVSFLPKLEAGAYPQMPYEGITEAEYEAYAARIKPVVFGVIEQVEAAPDKFCDGSSCVLAGGA